MSIRRILRNRVVFDNNEDIQDDISDSNSSLNSSTNSNFYSQSSSSSFASFINMPFDAKEAREAIPLFLGKQNFQQFIAICDELFDDLGEDGDDSALVRIIKQKLSSEAFTLCRNCATYKEIEKVLSKKYGEDTPLTVLIRKAVNLKQFDNEDVKSYGDRAVLLQEKINLLSEELLKRANIECKESEPVAYIHSKIILEYFIGGLRIHDVRNIVKSNNFTELNKAAEYAASVEKNYLINSRTKFENEKKFSNFKKEPVNNNNSNRPQIKREPYNGNNRPQIKKEINTNNRPQMTKERAVCYFCGKIGHYERNCFQKQRSQINILESKNEALRYITPPDLEALNLMKSLGIQ